ncbi:transcription initiation factor TFIIH subunit [Saitoella coloradoensis]
MSDDEYNFGDSAAEEDEDILDLGNDSRGKKSAAASGYAWEEQYQRSWDVVQEDAAGSLAGVVAGIIEAGKRKRLLKDTTPIQRGIIRHLILVLDFSSAMSEKDLRPNRQELTITYACDFITEYFEQNPISQLGIIGMRNGVAVRISEVHGNTQDHIAALQALRKQEPSGDPSLQNALEMCRASLHHVPTHGTREVLIVFGALLSSDPGDIHKTIRNLVQDKVRVRIVGLAAQVAVCAELCRATNGGSNSAYGVILNEHHFRDLLFEATTPPTQTAKKVASTLITMGFPSRAIESVPSLCACHSIPLRTGYSCPRCSSKVCSLPMECPTCGLTLVLSTHLARSYHHLFPLRNWDEVPWDKALKSTNCFACLAPFPTSPIPSGKQKSAASSGRFACPQCGNHFCVDCDVFAHEHLHNCPGCESSSPARKQQLLAGELGNVASANGDAMQID